MQTIGNVGRCVCWSLLIAAATTGCATGGRGSVATTTPVSPQQPGNSPIDTSTILAVADSLGRDLLNTEALYAAKARTRESDETPYIVMRQIRNETRDRRFGFDTNIILDRMIVQLNSQYGHKLRFVDRVRGGTTAEPREDIVVERERQRGGVFESSGLSDSIAGATATFFIDGTVRSFSAYSNRLYDDSIFFFMQMVDMEGRIIWAGEYGPYRTQTRIGRGER